MIAIIDTAVANLQSVVNAVERLELSYVVTHEHETIARASHVILPGVGHARACMQRLNELDLLPLLRSLKQPVLGICLGMQVLFESTAEGDCEGLGVLPGRVEKIQSFPGLSLPHMGWNTLELVDPSSPLLRGIFTGDRVYFVHSFRAPLSEQVPATTFYGESIPAVVARDNFFGTQFHPERSGSVGLAILRNFGDL